MIVWFDSHRRRHRRCQCAFYVMHFSIMTASYTISAFEASQIERSHKFVDAAASALPIENVNWHLTMEELSITSFQSNYETDCFKTKL